MENVIFRYSDFVDDDGGFLKVKADFVKLGEELIAEAKRLKSEINKNLTFDNPEATSAYEKQVKDIIDVNNQYQKSYKDLNTAISSHAKEVRDAIAVEIAIEKAKQENMKTTRQQIQAEGDLNKAIITENNALKSGIALQEAQRRQREASENTVKKEQDAYGQLSAQLNALFRETASVATQMYLLEEAGDKTSPTYQKLANDFTNLQGRTLKLDGALKTIDASLGRHQRKVGEYERGYGGLNNAVGQIARELPAFTFSMQTGLLGISNNIPILVDEINRLKKSNLELVASGKETQSIFKGLVGALFSFNTIMSISLLLLTTYGKEIGNFFSEILKGTEALNDASEALIGFNNAQVKGTISTKDELQTYNEYVKIAGDKTLGYEKQKIAIDYLRKSYGGYLDALSDEQIMKLKGSEIDKKLSTILGFGEQYKANLKEVQSINEKIEVYKNEIKARQEYYQAIKEQEKIRFNSSSAPIDVLNADKTIKALQKQEDLRKSAIKDEKLKGATTAQISTSLTALEYVYQESLKRSQILKEKSLLLERQREKEEKKNIKQVSTVDFEASQFALRKKVLEDEIKINEEVAGSAKFTNEVRVDAQSLAVTELVALAEIEKTESLRVLKRKYEEEKNETIKDSKGKVIAKKYSNKGLLELEKQYGFDVETAQKEYTERIRQAQLKGEKVAFIETQQRQIENLKYWQTYLSTSAEMYQDYSRKISVIQNEIDRVINLSKILDTKDKLQMSADELKRTEELSGALSKELEARGRLTTRQIEKFQKRQELVQKNAETQRKIQRTYAIAEEQKSFEKGTAQWEVLETERQNIITGLENDGIKDRLQNQKDAIERWKEFLSEVNQIVEKVLDKMLEITQKRVDQENTNVENQKKAVETQERRAELGLSNTLAFEQRALGEREAMLIKQQKREERLQKIKSLWTSYASYADKDPDTAIAKALRDFALLETISATFGDGGIVNDKLPSDGIFRGQSHKGNNGGIPILVEGREGIFSAREMDNLGKDNFYKMKNIASAGRVDSDFFSRQRKQFVATTSRRPKESNNDQGWIEVKKAIENKPVSNWDVASVAHGTMKLVEETLTKNGKKRNTYTIKKARF